MEWLIPVLGVIIGSFFASLIGGVALRAAIALLRLPREYGLGHAARAVFYPFLIGAGARLGILWAGPQVLGGNQPWLPWAAAATFLVLFVPLLFASIRSGLQVGARDAGLLTAITAGSLVVLGVAINVALSFAGVDLSR